MTSRPEFKKPGLATFWAKLKVAAKDGTELPGDVKVRASPSCFHVRLTDGGGKTVWVHSLTFDLGNKFCRFELRLRGASRAQHCTTNLTATRIVLKQILVLTAGMSLQKVKKKILIECKESVRVSKTVLCPQLLFLFFLVLAILTGLNEARVVRG